MGQWGYGRCEPARPYDSAGSRVPSSGQPRGERCDPDHHPRAGAAATVATPSMIGQGYKLRLGDGTTFAVDEKGLQTWLQGKLVDQNARIQPAGSNKWFTIRQLQALEREMAEQAAFEQRAI